MVWLSIVRSIGHFDQLYAYIYVLQLIYLLSQVSTMVGITFFLNFFLSFLFNRGSNFVLQVNLNS